jgi:hypothetical protein
VVNWWERMIKSKCNSLLKRISKLIFQIHFRALLSWVTRMKVALAKGKNYNLSTKAAKGHWLHLRMLLVLIRTPQTFLMVNLDQTNYYNEVKVQMQDKIKRRFRNNLSQRTLMTYGSKRTWRGTAQMMGWTKVEVTSFKAKNWFKWFKIKEQWLGK